LGLIALQLRADALSAQWQALHFTVGGANASQQQGGNRDDSKATCIRVSG